MSSITTTVTRQYHLQEWTSQIRECQNRPQNLTVKCKRLVCSTSDYSCELLLSFAPGS